LPSLVAILGALGCASLIAGSESADAAAAAAASGSRRIQFGAHGELIVDGQRRFIRGGYRSGQEDKLGASLRSAAAAGFDMVHDYHFESFDLEQGGVDGYIEEARRYLQAADRAGLGVFLGLPRTVVQSADEDSIASIVNGLRGERALWMWYVYDEPKPFKLSLDAAATVYALLKRLDPGHPAIILANRPDTVQQYQSYCDVLWYDRYPIAATDPKGSSVRPIADVLDATKKAVPAGKPVWPVLQAHDNAGNPKLRERRPTLPRPDDANHRPNEAELRAQAHVAIARGAPAVVYYWGPSSWYSMKTDTPRIWSSLTRVLGELHTLEPVLLDSEAPDAVNVSAGGSVLNWTRRHDGKLIVGVVNTDVNSPAQASIRGAQAAGPFRKLLGDGTLTADNQGATVRLGPAGVLVLEADSR
jgi:hypothetical protein